MKIFSYSSAGLTLLLSLWSFHPVRAQNVIYDSPSNLPKPRASATVVQQPMTALRTDGGTDSARVYTVRADTSPPPVQIQQKQTTVTTIQKEPAKKTSVVSVKHESQESKVHHSAKPKKKEPVLTKASKETTKTKKHAVVQETKTAHRPTRTVITHEKTLTAQLPASETTWVDSGSINALVPTPNGAPHLEKSHITTISTDLPQPVRQTVRETTVIETSAPKPDHELSRKEVIDARLFPAASEP